MMHALNRRLAFVRETRLIDLGGGCGGSLNYVLRNKRFATAEAALADSSEVALRYASEQLPVGVRLYQADLHDCVAWPMGCRLAARCTRAHSRR